MIGASQSQSGRDLASLRFSDEIKPESSARNMIFRGGNIRDERIPVEKDFPRVENARANTLPRYCRDEAGSGDDCGAAAGVFYLERERKRVRQIERERERKKESCGGSRR